MVFADTFEIKYKLNFNTSLKKGSAVKHFLEKNYLDFSNKQSTYPSYQFFN